MTSASGRSGGATRARSRWVVCGAVVGSTVLVAPTAVASWSSVGSGAAVARATSIDAVAQAPTVAAQGGVVRIGWTASTLTNGAAVDGYRVQRHVGDVVTTVCTTSTPTELDCDDPAPAASAARYGVVAYKAKWTASESPLSATLVSDTTAPVTSLNRTPAGSSESWTAADVVVDLVATDAGAGVRDIHWRVNNGPEQVAAGAAAHFTIAREDANTVIFWAVDHGGNIEAVNEATIRVDKRAPVTAVSAPPSASGWYAGDTQVTVTSTDVSPDGGLASGVGRQEYRLGTATAWTSVPPDGRVTITESGLTTMHYRSVDLAGNEEVAKSIVVKIDRTAPGSASAAVAPTANPGSWNNTPVRVTGSFVDADSGVAEYRYSTSETGLYTVSNNGFLVSSEGVRTIWTRAVDAVGNISLPFAKEVKVDLTAPAEPSSIFPVGNQQYPASGSWPASSDCLAGQVCATATDALSGVASVHYTLVRNSGDCWTGSAWASPSGSVSCSQTMPQSGPGRYKSTGSAPLLQPGNRSYTLTITAADNAGNTTSKSVPFTSR